MANEQNKVKKFTKSTIAMIVCLAFIGVLILATILMALIPTDKGIKFAAPDLITVTYGEHYGVFAKNNEDYNKIWEEYQKACKQPVIAALFGGYLGKGMKAEYSSNVKDYSNIYTTDKSDSDNEDDSTETKETTNCFVIQFTYLNAQFMKNGNGSDYEYGDTADSKFKPLFTDAYIQITNDNALQLKTVYLKSDKDSSSSTKTHATYTGVANFNSLYDLLKTIEGSNKLINNK